MNVQCPKCNAVNSPNTAFCANCGFDFQQVPPVKNSNNLKIILIVLGCILGSCVLCGVVGAIQNAINPKNTETKSVDNSQNQPEQISDADQRRNENVQKAKAALADGYDEKNNKFGRVEEAEKLVSDIGYYDKQYAEAQEILKEVNRRKELIAKIPAPKEIAMRDVTVKANLSKGGFGTVLLGDITITNPTKFTVKDVSVKCDVFGSSGTPLNTKNQTIYEIVEPGKSKTAREVNFGFINQQTSKFSCSVDDLVVVQ